MAYASDQLSIATGDPGGCPAPFLASTTAADWRTEPWTPNRAATLCHRGVGPAEVVAWSDLTEAATAARDLLGGLCGPDCRGAHNVVYTDAEAGVHVVAVPTSNPVPTLAEELAALYPVHCNPHRADRLPLPPPLPELNRSLTPTPTGAPDMNHHDDHDHDGHDDGHDDLQAAQDKAVADAKATAGNRVTPHPNGLPGRVADAIAESAEAFDALDAAADAGAAVGDAIDRAIGADMLAAALVDAAFCEPQNLGG